MRIQSLKAQTQMPRFAWLALAIAVFLLLPQVASANAAPPMPRTWFTFTDAAGQPAAPTKAWIFECGPGDVDCKDGVALWADFSQCGDTSICLAGTTKAGVKFGCSGNHCLFMSSNEGIPARFKLVTQLGDQRYTSDVVDMPEQRGYTERHFKVSLTHDGRATLTTDLNIPSLVPRGDFGLAFLLTLVSELIVIALVLKWRGQPLWPLLGFAALMQVLSFPAVWSFFPSLLPWHLGSERLVGVVLLISVLGLGGLLIWVRLAPTRNSRIISIVLLVLAVPVSFICLVSTFLIAGYGSNEFPQTYGLSYPIMLAAAELFAVVFEAVLLYFLSRRTLSIQRSALISLVANAVSFVLGLLLFPIAPPLV